MKIYLLIVMVTMLLTSCVSGMQEVQVTNAVPTTESPPTRESPTAVITQEPTFTEQLVATVTEVPTNVPSQTPPGCVTLLTPADGAELPALGKVTFSWDPLNAAPNYVLSITLPSGQTVSFDAEQTFREQYIEAFTDAGEYQWRVSIQDRKRNEICSSELATFSKPESPRSPGSTDDDRKKK